MAREKLAVIALLGVAVCSSVWGMLDVMGAYSKNTQSLSIDGFEYRFGELPKLMTPQMVLGYLTDLPADDPASQAEFYLTQYTLAPAILIADSSLPMLVTNLHSGKPDLAALQARHITPIKDFGNGVMLCRNTSR